MHLKKTKKTPRMFRMIALMLSLVPVFFTMTGMALIMAALLWEAACKCGLVLPHPGAPAG